MIGSLIQDFRHATRRLGRSPAFTAAAVATLALGIGMNTALFSVVSGVLLRPLEWRGSEELVRIWVSPDEPGGGVGNMSYPDAADLAEMTTSFRSLVAYSPGTVTLTEPGDASQVEVARVTEGLLGAFLEAPTVGRDIRSDEWGSDGAQVAVISHGFWQDRFGGDPNVVGRSLRLGDTPYEVVGVAPRGFDYPRNTRLWIPRIIDPESCGRGCHTWHVVARRADGVTLEAARADVDRVAELLRDSYPGTNGEKSFLVRSLLDEEVGSVRRALWLLLGAVGLVLIIACANVAGLFLVRASARRQEVAVRAALGAGRGRLRLEVLAEAIVLAVLGGVAGLLLAFGAVEVLRALGRETIPRIDDLAVDLRVLAYATVVVAGVALACGLIPARRVSRVPLVEASAGSRGGAGARGNGRSRHLLMAGEVALSLVLLVGAGLFLRTFVEMGQVELGYRTDGIVRFDVTAPGTRYQSVQEQRTFFRTLESRIAGLPGVDTVGSAFAPPLGRGRATGGVRVEGRPVPPAGEGPLSELNPVGPGWLETYGIPLARGRSLASHDGLRGEGPVPALVNQAFAESIFPGEEPLGQVITVGVDFGWGAPAMEVVGVVRDIRNAAIVDEAAPQVYPVHGGYGRSSMNVAVRVSEGTDPLTIVPAIRSELARLDPLIPLFRIESLEEAVSREMAPTRLYLLLTGAFAVVGLVLAAVGLYGVVAYAVSTRTREIGIRMALGADASRVLRQVVVSGLLPTGVGLAIGLFGAVTGSRVMEALVYGTRPADPAVLVGAAGILGIVATLAVFVPARRAAAVEPAITLREE